MSDRELLEKQAEELGVQFDRAIPDDDLLKLLEAAKARAALETRAESLGIKFPPNIGDEKLSEKISKIEAKADPKVPDAPDQGNASTDIKTSGEVDLTPPQNGRVKVVCAIAAGRRRAGRRWSGGETIIDGDDLTKAELDELKTDPLFSVVTAD